MVPSIIVKLCVQILHQEIITESPEVNNHGLLFRVISGERMEAVVFLL